MALLNIQSMSGLKSVFRAKGSYSGKLECKRNMGFPFAQYSVCALFLWN